MYGTEIEIETASHTVGQKRSLICVNSQEGVRVFVCVRVHVLDV